MKRIVVWTAGEIEAINNYQDLTAEYQHRKDGLEITYTSGAIEFFTWHYITHYMLWEEADDDDS